jgi:opacity protein-like surface antigen
MYFAVAAICFAPVAFGQQYYNPQQAGVPVVSPQQAQAGVYRGTTAPITNTQNIGYNNQAAAAQAAANGCDSNGCDGNACDGNACDGAGCGIGNGCGIGGGLRGHLYDPCCPTKYFSVYGGASDWKDIKFFDDNGGSTFYGSGGEFAIGGALGRSLGRRFRGEFDVTWRRGEANYFEANSGTSVIISEPATGQADVYSFMPNLLVDLNPNGRINGYIGVGGGVAFTNLDYISNGGTRLDINGSSFAYQGIFGVSARVSQRAELFFEYRYFSTDDQSFSFDGAGLDKVKLVSNDFLVGIRVQRW